MTHAKHRLWALGGALLVVGAAACADMSADAFSGLANPGADRSADAGAFNESTGAAAPPNADLGPTDNGIILVHAAGAPSFRLCFANDLDRLPTPDAELMPQANVVGVEVGSAVRIAPLATPPGVIHLFSEPLIRALYPAGQKGPTCRTLLNDVPSTVVGDISTDLSRGVHLLMLRGCAKMSPVRTYTKAECGDDYTDATGNLSVTTVELKGTTRAPITETSSELPSQVIHLSQSLETFRGQQKLNVSFGDITAPSTIHKSTATSPNLGGPPTDFVSAPSFDPSDVGVYSKVGFRVMVGATTVAEQSLANVQILSAPRDVPPSYYAVASNYVLLLLGDPAPKLPDGGADTAADERRRLHLLAVPVIEPKPDAGAETDGGASADGGS